ncbi:4-hydroxy-tetrahydrodipicolinate reductase 1, chloroplastic-like [Eucalyptus grandis]|uniref:4-hydroxy-tetrahydrodipicolinate reductase 1, chloroplastic-like n=1 Tax=Eucalyptus grandis TaxID=71139 RepID=UPI00192EE29F|nr:4-hydroxy-tetrahydrodipicolinate reductase 1, chloroplastic-like [Eucalyptus grandis]
MGKAVINAADSAGLNLIPMSFGCAKEAGKTTEVCGKEIKVHASSYRESVAVLVFCEHPNMLVAVNNNTSLEKVVAFLVATEIMAEQFPGAFSGYPLKVFNPHSSASAFSSAPHFALSCMVHSFD